MKFYTKHIFVFSFFILFSFLGNAKTFTSVASGDWKSANKWDIGNGEIPGEFDDVVIKHQIYLDLTSMVKVKSITITNNLNKDVNFYLFGTDSLIVTENITGIAENFNKDIHLEVDGSATAIVNGNVNLTRASNNTSNKTFGLLLRSNSKTYILGDLEYTYLNAGFGENDPEMVMIEQALLDVSGKTKFLNSGGMDLDFELHGSSQAIFRDSLTLMLLSGGLETSITAQENAQVQILENAYLFNSGGATTRDVKLRTGPIAGKITLHKNLYLESVGTDSDIKFEARGANAELNLLGNLYINAQSEQSVHLHIREGGKLNLGGNLIRQTNFGYLEMDNNSTFNFNGTLPQTIPDSKLAGSGNDSLAFTNVGFQNTSSQAMVLTDDLYVNDLLTLTKGNIKTSPTAKIILADNALISGGSDSAYIEGPIQKLGRTNGSNMTFPVGTSAKYAPLTISPLTNSNSDVVVTYSSEPPPFGIEILEPSINNILPAGSWNVEKNAAAGDLDITLEWTSSEGIVINEIDDMIVTGWDGSMWKNYGQETAGFKGDGGFVESNASEPPPFGIVYLMIGSNSADNSLPVELKKFQAVPQKDKVILKWETGAEINSSHFEIEKSMDGKNFELLTSINSRGGVGQSTNYSVKDFSPYHGWNYYRLRMVDNDDSYEYSQVKAIKFAVGTPISIYPNPVKKMLYIEAKDWQGDEVTLEIFDSNGSQVYGNVISLENGNFQVATDNINVHSTGTYFIRITGKTDSQVLKFIKTE